MSLTADINYGLVCLKIIPICHSTAVEMKSRQLEVNKVEEELKRRSQEILELQLRLQEAEKFLVRIHFCFAYAVSMQYEANTAWSMFVCDVVIRVGTCCFLWSSKA